MKTFLYAVVAVGLCAGVSISACSSSESSPPAASTDGGGGSDSPSASEAASPVDAASDSKPAEAAAPDGSAECNAIANAAPEATQATIKGNAPAATGGTIAAGTYFLTEFTLYDPAGTASSPEPSGMHATLMIAGNVMDSVMDLGDGVDRRFSETFTVNGTDVDRVLTCPKPGPDLDAAYSVTGKNLVIYETDPSGNVAGSTWVKQ